jgi:hypothetical protein
VGGGTSSRYLMEHLFLPYCMGPACPVALQMSADTRVPVQTLWVAWIGLVIG